MRLTKSGCDSSQLGQVEPSLHGCVGGRKFLERAVSRLESVKEFRYIRFLRSRKDEGLSDELESSM